MVDIQRPFSAFTQRNEQSLPRRINSSSSMNFRSDRFEGLVAPKPVKAFTSTPQFTFSATDSHVASSYSSPNLAAFKSPSPSITNIVKVAAPMAIASGKNQQQHYEQLIAKLSTSQEVQAKVGSLEVDNELHQELRHSMNLFSSIEDSDMFSRSGSVSPDYLTLDGRRPSLDSSPASFDDTDSVCSAKSSVFGTPPSRAMNPLAYYCERSFLQGGETELELFSPSPVVEATQDNLTFEIEDIRI